MSSHVSIPFKVWHNLGRKYCFVHLPKTFPTILSIMKDSRQAWLIYCLHYYGECGSNFTTYYRRWKKHFDRRKVTKCFSLYSQPRVTWSIINAFKKILQMWHTNSSHVHDNVLLRSTNQLRACTTCTENLYKRLQFIVTPHSGPTLHRYHFLLNNSNTISIQFNHL